MTLRRALIVLFLTALAALSGCGDVGGRRDGDTTTDPGLAPITYVVTGVTVDGKPLDLVTDTELRIRFTEDQVTLTAGCNTMSGGYQLEESRLSVAQLAMTELGCDPARTQQDAWLAGLFGKPVQLMTGAHASIVSAGTVLTMTDRRAVSPDLELDGTHWVLDTVIDGNVAESVPPGAQGYLNVNGDTLTVNDGCNTGSGPVRVEGGSLVFGKISMPTRPCPSTTSPVAGAVAEVITGRATYRIDEGRLTITNGEHGLGFRGVLAVR